MLINPEYFIPEEPNPAWKKNHNLLAKNTEPEKSVNLAQNYKLKQSLSFGKLGFGAKKVRTICDQDIL